MQWKSASESGLPPIEVVTLEQLIEHGRKNGANIVNDMPWSFTYKNHPVSHENDGRYLVGCLGVSCTKDNPVILFCDKVFNYWKNPGRLNIRYKGRPDVLITGEGNWCFWSGRSCNGGGGVDDYRGSHIRVKKDDLKHIEFLDESHTEGQQEWVSVEDRLPEIESKKFGDSPYVLCLGVSLHPYCPFVGWYNHNTKTWTVAHHLASSGSVLVTHWQPLPKPPIQ